MSQDRTAQAAQLMSRFAERTGLSSGEPPRRYLWTDAFAVCNLLGLGRATGEQRWIELALELVDRVHDTLGRHRSDDPRAGGWISGLDEHEGARHPTCGGLRIGKAQPERGVGAPHDPEREWDRDGQYFHYLTKWMHALDQVAHATGERQFNRWARELAAAAYRGFCRPAHDGGRLRMVWKASIDLSRALVPSMGHHDPLDGFITCLQLRASAARLPGEDDGPELAVELGGFSTMIEELDWRTVDPLGLGGLLTDAHRLAQLIRDGLEQVDLLPNLLEASHGGLRRYARQGELRRPAWQRLAFRELGLAIGLRALEGMAATVAATRRRILQAPQVSALIDALTPFAHLGSAIEAFWLDPHHRRAPTWTEHEDISDVMLATCLVPEGFSRLGAGPAPGYRAR